MDDHLPKPFSMHSMQEMLDRWIPRPGAASPKTAERAAQAAAKTADAIDRQVLDQLGALRTNGKAELLARTINLYLVESPKIVQQLKQAASANDAPGMASSAHSLKSCSANVGATMLSRYCEHVEASARRADTKEARKMIAKIEAEHSRVQSALTAESELLGAGKA
jgi:HPt (histidine-containing phosphotransfer) domain-containing protein